MSRTVKYLLTILLIIAAAMWILTVYRSCKAKENTTQTTNNLDATDHSSGSDATLDELYEDEDENATTGETSGETSGTDNSRDTDEAEENGTGDEDEGVTPSEFEEDSDVSVAGDGINRNGGEYLVVAGAFVSKRNAERYQKQLTRRSYDSEIRVFLGSEYHSVIIGEYVSRSEASSIAKKLGGEAYVHKKRYPKKRR